VNKKKQKNFAYWGRWHRGSFLPPAGSLLFFKKEALALLLIYAAGDACLGGGDTLSVLDVKVQKF